MSKAPVRKSPPHVRYTKEQVAGKWFDRTVVTCGGCGAQTSFARIPPDVIGSYLGQRGWLNPTSPRGIRCPACVDTARAVVVTESVQPAKPAAKPKEAAMANAEPPRIAQPEDNRRIYDALEAAYDVKARCYTGDMRDKTMAERLNVPAAWVAAVRERFFGADESQAGRDRVSKGAEAQRAAVALVQSEERLKALIESLLVAATSAETELNRSKQLRAEVNKLVLG